jgi:CheY-like chemotaxis protein
MLIRARAIVTEASSGPEALAELARARAAGHPYRLMLLDYRMPGMDGVEVARKAIEGGLARTSLSGQDTIILMLTSDDLNFRLTRMREAGLQTYLIKPVKRAELLEKIRHLLGGTGAEHALPELAEPPAVPADAIPLRILLAEDAPDNRFLIQAYLKKLPYRIEIAETVRSRSRSSRPPVPTWCRWMCRCPRSTAWQPPARFASGKASRGFQRRR